MSNTRNYIQTDTELFVFDNIFTVGIDIRYSERCSGVGAFATKKMKSHTLLGQYKGLFIDPVKVYSTGSALLMHYGASIYTDVEVSKHTSWHHYMNMSYKTKQRANVRMTLSGLMYTIYNIKVGEELLWNYDSNYVW
jgi:hypothetical protein